MTKEITKSYILQSIQDKFKLRELVPETFAFAETVVPIYDVEMHLQEHRTQYAEGSITAIGGVIFFTVPQDERWILRGYNIVFMGAGAYTVAGAYVARLLKTSGATFYYLDLAAGQSVSYAVDLANPLILTHGDKLGINIDGYTSTQDLRMYIDYILEKER